MPGSSSKGSCKRHRARWSDLEEDRAAHLLQQDCVVALEGLEDVMV